MYLSGFQICLKVLGLFFRFTGILLVVLDCYEFMVIYSLHKKFQDESERGESEEAPECIDTGAVPVNPTINESNC